MTTSHLKAVNAAIRASGLAEVPEHAAFVSSARAIAKKMDAAVDNPSDRVLMMFSSMQRDLARRTQAPGRAKRSESAPASSGRRLNALEQFKKDRKIGPEYA